jgi:hypothetical protein
MRGKGAAIGSADLMCSLYSAAVGNRVEHGLDLKTRQM